jgi:hypothetical protein
MTHAEIKSYLSGETPRTFKTNPMVVHGEINMPAFLVTHSSQVVIHKPTGAGSRNV